MKITCIAETFIHQIRYFEFIRPDGRLITAFFQVLQKPDVGIGCFDKYDDAVKLINDPHILEDWKSSMPLINLKAPTSQLFQES